MARNKSHRVKIGPPRRTRRKTRVHHRLARFGEALTTRKAPGRQPEGLQRSIPSAHGSRSANSTL